MWKRTIIKTQIESIEEENELLKKDIKETEHQLQRASETSEFYIQRKSNKTLPHTSSLKLIQVDVRNSKLDKYFESYETRSLKRAFSIFRNNARKRQLIIAGCNTIIWKTYQTQTRDAFDKIRRFVEEKLQTNLHEKILQQISQNQVKRTQLKVWQAWSLMKAKTKFFKETIRKTEMQNSKRRLNLALHKWKTQKDNLKIRQLSYVNDGLDKENYDLSNQAKVMQEERQRILEEKERRQNWASGIFFNLLDQRLVNNKKRRILYYFKNWEYQARKASKLDRIVQKVSPRIYFKWKKNNNTLS